MYLVMAAMHVSQITLLLCLLPFHGCDLPCAPRAYGENSVVCVCNATYCDTLEGPPSTLDPGTAYVVQSTKAGDRFKATTLAFTPSTIVEEVTKVLVDPSQEMQEMIGFGGAFTDAAGINFLSLPESMRFHIVRAYYSSNGSEYSMGRVPMGSCDFSTEIYTYDDHHGDLDLKSFQLADQDMHYKIPFLQEAQSVSPEALWLFGSPWSPPAWMKTNNRTFGPGTLRGPVGGPYYQAWANYFVKFLQAYEAENLTFWGLTAQNEPVDGFIPLFPFQCLGFTPSSQGTFVAQNLGPALQKAGYGTDKIKLMILDDHRFLLPHWAETVFSNESSRDYVSGIAFHWYTNRFSSPSALDRTREKFPDKFLLSTEACEGSYPWQRKVKLGDWDRAESYAHDIAEDIQHWTSGWVDWNLALDLEGGPNWVKNFVDSPVIVNASAAEFYKQPMYYALAHFSKFVKRGSKRVESLVQNCCSPLEQVAFKTTAGQLVLVVINRKDVPVTLEVREVGSDVLVRNLVPGHSIQTYLWSPATQSNEV